MKCILGPLGRENGSEHVLRRFEAVRKLQKKLFFHCFFGILDSIRPDHAQTTPVVLPDHACGPPGPPAPKYPPLGPHLGVKLTENARTD